MTHILEIGDEIIWIILIFLIVALSPAIIMSIIGLFVRKKSPKASKILFISSVVYVIVGLGVCGILSI
jgi:Na+/proline symporter